MADIYLRKNGRNIFNFGSENMSFLPTDRTFTINRKKPSIMGKTTLVGLNRNENLKIIFG
jgi:hypothetical protein